MRDIYSNMPSLPADMTMGKIFGRMVDALGYRYYWATEGLVEKDTSFVPVDGARSLGETLSHILSLCALIEKSVKGEIIDRQSQTPDLSLEKMIGLTNHLLTSASVVLNEIDDNSLQSSSIQIKKGGETVHFPIWYLIHGPIADAIHHVGQIVTMRRMISKPINAEVNYFLGVGTAE